MFVSPLDPATFPPFLRDGGMMGEIIARFPWSETSLGDIDGWPPSLKTTVALILRSPIPIVTLWGEAGFMIYNDAYSEFAGGRHPRLLGSEVRKGWPEVADFNDNVMKVGLSGGVLSYQDQELTLNRTGAPESVWMNLDYSPVIGEDGRPIGVIAIVVETTAKVRAQRQLIGERERLGTMFEQAPGFMALLVGPDHTFTLINRAYSTLVGYREVIGKPVAVALPEAGRQGFVELLDKLYRSGDAYSGVAVPFTIEATAATPAQSRFLDFIYQPLKDQNGEVFGIFVQGADVTDRVLAEQATRERETQFRALAQAVPNQVWTASAEGEFDWFNERVYEYSGMRPGELDGRDWVRVVHGEDVGDAALQWARALTSGDTYETEFRIRRADGQYRWHLVRALPVRNETGQIARWVGTNTDIEEQKVAAEALAHLNATLEQQIAQRTVERDRMWRLATDVLLAIDGQGRIVAANPALHAHLQWSNAEVAGRSFFDFVHPDDVERTAAQFDALRAETERSFKLENRYRRKDGGYSILEWTGAEEDDFIYAAGRDITAEREAAQAMQRTEQALRQSQKMETIGKLTGGVAHDFNNLLQVISGNLQLLTRDLAGNERALRRVDSALGGVARGAKLASYLLAFGRRQALEPRVVKISRFITDMEDMLHRSLGEEIEIEMIVSGGLWNTFVDTAQVENAVLNLCINARDAMDGVGKLTIELGNAYLDHHYTAVQGDVTPGQYVMIAVSDTGTGMTPEVMEQAFEPFFSTKPEGKGTGLGLSMVYGFVKQSGGHVKLYSEVGEGTTVKLYLPRSLESEDRISSADLPPAVGGNETILVAEDDESVRATVVEMLGELGYRVLKASNATSALAIIDSGLPIDLLFTDVVMPGPLRSPDLARKARERLPGIAVLFTSGYTENAIVHGGRLDAGVELLGKPYTREALARKVRHVLGNQKQRALIAGAKAEPSAPREPDPCRSGRKVLLVEDDDDIRLNTAEMLETLGYSVRHAADGEAALAALDAEPAEVLITDIGLPGMSGEVLAALARQRVPGIRIVYASGQESPGLKGAASWLRKPYDLPGLEAALTRLPQ